MGWKAIVAGEEALATDAQTYFMDQVTAQFVDTAQRTAQLPAPKKGQCSTLESRTGVIQVFDGSNWVDSAPFVQSGNGVVFTNAAGGAVINYATPFAAAPFAVQIIDFDALGSGGIIIAVIGSQNTPTAVGFLVRTLGGVPAANVPVRVGYMAHGLRI